MKITKFSIENFKSINRLTLNLQPFGKGTLKSSVSILVGLNESGKSSILEAINIFQEGFKGKDFVDNFYKGANDNETYIWIEAELDIENLQFYQKKISELLKLEETFTSKIEITSLRKITWQDSKSYGSFYSIKIKENLPLYEYILTGDTEKEIRNLKEAK